MLSKKMEDALNEQINAELWSAYLYLSMGMQFENSGMAGVANWFKIQFKEEQAHAEIFMNYINQRGGRVILKPIAAVETEWATPLDAFKDTLAHERKVTALINNLYAIAEEEHDYATRDRLTWFVNEQPRYSSTSSPSSATTAWVCTCSTRNLQPAPTWLPQSSQPSNQQSHPLYNDGLGGKFRRSRCVSRNMV